VQGETGLLAAYLAVIILRSARFNTINLFCFFLFKVIISNMSDISTEHLKVTKS
jgi:hypothetical protein